VHKIKTDSLDNDGLKVGERLYQYQDKYKKHQESIKEHLKETYSFKPHISKNTDEILKNREKALEEVRQKYSLQDGGNKRAKSSPHLNQINEVTDENKQETEPPVIDKDLTDYYKKLESRFNE
jgi:hypothetical protein